MADARFRAAARAYVVYGLVYLVGGLYLVAHGVGVKGASMAERERASASGAAARRYPYTIDQAIGLCRDVARDMSQRDPLGTAGQLYWRSYDHCMDKELREMVAEQQPRAAQAPSRIDAVKGATTRTLLRWGLIGLVPLVVVPWLLSRRWSWLGGWISRRAFAWLLAALLAVRALKVGEAAVRSAGAVAAPWGGEITFRAGALVFLVVTLTALVFVVRAALPGREGDG